MNNGAEDASTDGISTSDVSTAERGGSELENSTKVEVGECEAVVLMRDNGLDVVEENVYNSEEDTNINGSFMIKKDKERSDNEMKQVKERK